MSDTVTELTEIVADRNLSDPCEVCGVSVFTTANHHRCHAIARENARGQWVPSQEDANDAELAFTQFLSAPADYKPSRKAFKVRTFNDTRLSDGVTAKPKVKRARTETIYLVAGTYVQGIAHAREMAAGGKIIKASTQWVEVT